MRTYLDWFLLLSKAQLKKVSFWILVVAMLLLVFLAHVIALPKSENNRILVTTDGLEGADLEFAEAVTKQLLKLDSVYDIEQVDSVKEMKQQVLAAKALCGIDFKEGIYNACKRNDPEEVMGFYVASFANTKEVAKEVVYAGFFSEYSTLVLTEHVEDIYENPTDEMKEELILRTKEYLEGKTLFSVEKVGYEDSTESDTIYKTDISDVSAVSDVFPVKGIIALVMFLAIFLARGEKTDYFQKYLSKKKKWAYGIIKMLATAIPFMVIGLIVIIVSGNSKGLGIELLGMVVLILSSYLISCLFKLVYRKEEHYVTFIFGLLLLNLVICPIFFELGELIGAVRYVRMLFPVGIYLELFG